MNINPKPDTSLDEFIDDIYYQTHIPIAIFDKDGSLLATCDEVCICDKNFEEEGEHHCAVFTLDFTAHLFAGKQIEDICERCKRTSSKIVTVGDQTFHIVLFHYNLANDKPYPYPDASNYPTAPMLTPSERLQIYEVVEEKLKSMFQ
ncbi:MAG: hypothetical protein LBO69_00010 [Ignavibacteria bacterium]|jgi:hypothetical protein|nr:hypothetical protein [Ignavibacteria bacterium]